MKTLTINNLKLKNPLILSPMVDVTNLPYRLLCRAQGASLAYTEMIYISAMLHKNPKTESMMQTCKEDSPLGLQITGNNIEEFKKVSQYAKPFSLVDINCGCPSIRIIGNQAGSYLLKSPEKIANAIKILKKQDLTVTAKIRLGFNKNNVLKIAKTIEKAGADALTVHARLANQSYSIPAQWNEIKKLKPKIGIPIIGNGDLLTPEKTSAMLEIADGAMIARGALGNPQIFKQSLDYLRTGKYKPTTPKDKIKQLLEYIKLAKKHKLESSKQIKAISSYFISGFPNASSFRNKLMQAQDLEEIKNTIEEINPPPKSV